MLRKRPSYDLYNSIHYVDPSGYGFWDFVKKFFGLDEGPGEIIADILGVEPWLRQIFVNSVNAGYQAYREDRSILRAVAIEVAATTAEYAVVGASCAIDLCAAGQAGAPHAGKAVREALAEAEQSVVEMGVTPDAAKFIALDLVRPTVSQFTQPNEPSTLGTYRVQSTPQLFNNDPVIYEDAQIQAWGLIPGIVGSGRPEAGIIYNKGMATGEAFAGSTWITVYGNPTTGSPSSWLAAVRDRVGYIPGTGWPLYGWRVVNERHARSLSVTYQAEWFFRNRR